jgi:AraC-like DNA-binding protein
MEDAMNIAELSNEIGTIFANKSDCSFIFPPTTPGLGLFELAEKTEFEAAIYNPIACLILQGEKQIAVGEQSVTFGAGESLIIGHDLPVTSRITKADRKSPYRAILITLDLEIVRNLSDQVGETTFNKNGNDVLGVSQTDPALIDALGRYFALASRPYEAEVMAPLIFKEIHFRLLTAPHGGMLRRLLRRDSHASRIGLAIEQIRKDFRTTLAVSELAEIAGMSPSSFHGHFRSVTETTPLQFQKDLRLVEARRLLSEQSLQVSSAAFEVGYESPTQFSREYARKFGVSPKEHVGEIIVSA